MDLETCVRRLLGETVGLHDWTSVPANEDLRRYGMNSLNCIRLVVAIEEAFDIEVPHQRLGIRYVGTIEDICRLIESIQNGTLWLG